MASSSERPDRNGARSQNGILPPPSSPTDSVAQAMKNDLEELIGYIDNLAFDQKNNNSAPKAAGTPSTNKQLFPSHENHTSERNVILQDRTNKVISNTQRNVTPAKLREPELAKVMSPMRYHDNSLNLSYERKERQTKVLDPVGNRASREEPAGSPPPQEASLYFHDESFSLNLSESQDAGDESNVSFHISSDKRSMEGMLKNDLGRPPRLLSTLQKNGLVSSPERSKAISFVSISKDPTPSKPFRSSSKIYHEHNEFSTPTAHGKNGPFSGNGEDSELRRKRLESRQATPFPRNQSRDIDRLEQENLDRKGNEWWRARPEAEDNHTEHDASVRFDTRDTASMDENKNGKSLKWEHVESFTSPIRRPQYSKGTPHPSKKISDTVLATPVPDQGSKSNLVLTSPESAKKLLRSAMEALQDARKERDEARQWADDIKKSVNQWVEDQRRLIRTESASLTENSNPASTVVFERKHQDIQISMNDLRNEMKSFKFDTMAHINSTTKTQDEKIHELSRQIHIVEDQLALVLKEGTSNQRDVQNIPSRIPHVSEKPVAGLAHKTPINETSQLVRSGSRSDASHVSQRTRRATPSGGHLIDYGNGVTKELHPDGTTVTRFKNGDVETRFDPKTSTTKNPSATCKVAYYHFKEQVLQITQRDGSVLYEYANGQVERHCADGVKIVLFPDGTKTVV